MAPRFPVLALLATIAATLGSSSNAIAQQAAETFDLHGEVVNSVTGQPIGGALVRLYGPQNLAQFSSSDGTFDFTGLPRGQFPLSARKPGFFDEQEHGGWTVYSAPSDQDVVLKLAPEGIIYGRVTDAGGQPVERVTVRAEHWMTADGRKHLEAGGITATDDLGDFRIAGLRPGTYFVTFKSTGPWRLYNRLSSKTTDSKGYGAEFYPGVTDLVSATAIPVDFGTQTQITQTLNEKETFQIAGIVLGASQAPGLGLMVTDSSGDSVQTAVRLERSTGRFQISGIPAGNYMLSAIARVPFPFDVRSARGQQLRADLPISVHSDISGVVLALGAGISIPVHVDDETTGSESVNVHQVWIQLMPEGSQAFSPGVVAPRFERGQRSTAALEGVMPGTYTAEVRPSGPYYVSDLRCGPVDLLRNDLSVSPTGSVPPIDVTIRDDGAQLSGTVTQNGRPVQTGVLIYSSDDPGRSQVTQTMNDGRFTFVNVPPGTYAVVADKQVRNLEFRNSEAMKSYLVRASAVTLGPRDQSTIQLELPSTDEARQ
jgi:Carboxypeptidase regulatory-like domain